MPRGYQRRDSKYGMRHHVREMKAEEAAYRRSRQEPPKRRKASPTLPGHEAYQAQCKIELAARSQLSRGEITSEEYEAIYQERERLYQVAQMALAIQKAEEILEGLPDTPEKAAIMELAVRIENARWAGTGIWWEERNNMKWEFRQRVKALKSQEQVIA